MPKLLEWKSHTHLCICAECKHDRVTDRLLSRVSAEDFPQIYETWDENGQATCEETQNLSTEKRWPGTAATKENVQVASLHVPADAEELTRACH